MLDSIKNSAQLETKNSVNGVAQLFRQVSAIVAFTVASSMAVVGCKCSSDENQSSNVSTESTDLSAACKIEFSDALSIKDLENYASKVDQAKQYLASDDLRSVDLTDPFNEKKWVFWIAHSRPDTKEIFYQAIKYSDIQEKKPNGDRLALADVRIVDGDKNFEIYKAGPANGVNTSFKITVPKGHVVLANKRPVVMDETDDEKYLREVVYTPFHEAVDREKLQYTGLKYLHYL